MFMFMSIGYQGYVTNIKINIFTPGAEIDIYVRWLISTMLKHIIGLSKHVWSFWTCFKLFESQGNYVWSE